jgi:hypothetical protein
MQYLAFLTDGRRQIQVFLKHKENRKEREYIWRVESITTDATESTG